MFLFKYESIEHKRNKVCFIIFHRKGNRPFKIELYQIHVYLYVSFIFGALLLYNRGMSVHP